MKPRWQVSTFVWLIIVLLASAACGGSGGSNGAGQKVTITFATPTSGTTAELQNLKQIINEFNQSHPTITVQLSQTPFDSYDNAIETQFRGGAGPDVMLVNFVDLGTWKDAGYLQDLTPSLNAAKRSVTDYAPGFYSNGTFDGHQYGLPVVQDVRALYYNKAIFARYHLQPPTTWSEMLSVAQTLNQHGIYGMAANMDNYWSGVWEVSGNFLLSNGGSILSSDGTRAVASQNPNTVQAYQYFFNTLRPYFPPGTSNMSLATVESLFASGKLAMYECGPWFADGIVADNPAMTFGNGYGIVPLPKSTYTGQAISASGGWFIGISKNTQQQQAAWDFLNYFTQPSLTTKVAQAQSDMPPTLSAYQSAPWNTAFYQPFYAQLPTGVSPVRPLVSQLGSVTNTLWKQLQLIAAGSESVQDGLKNFDSQANTILQSSK